MKRVLLSILIVLIAVFAIGCKNNDKNSTNINIDAIDNIEIELPIVDNEEESNEESKDESENVEDQGEGTGEAVIDEPVEIEPEEIDPEGKIFSKLTGLEISEEQSKVRPIVVMLDNHYKARPQAGLSDADVVYEVLAEGLITRYMAVFQSNQPDVIGPVRSARPYYIERALEFNPLYVHVGGSMAALGNIKDYNMADIDGLSVGGGVFYRTDHKNIPHNMYSSNDGIRNEANRKGYYTEVEFAGMPISYQSYDLVGEPANHVTIHYKKTSSGDSSGYSIYYRYDEANKNYYRYVNSVEHLDEETKIHLTADNIIIQQASHKVLDDAGRREIKLVGSGNGYYINKGTVMAITWQKNNAYSQTKYYDNDGSEVTLNPGVTWVQVIPSGTSPYIE